MLDRTTMWALVWGIVLLGLISSALAVEAKDLVQVSLVSDVREVKAGQSFHVGLLFKIKKGWHIYWKNPGDSGAATQAALHLPPGFSADEWQYPVPGKISDPSGTIYGYTDQVMLIAKVTPGPDVAGKVELSADANWLVCQKICLMGKGSAKLSLPADSDEANAIAQWMKRLPAVAGDRASVSVKSSGEGTNQKWSGVIHYKGPATAQCTEWFPGASDTVAFKDVNVTNDRGQITVSFSAERIGDMNQRAGQIESVLAYTLADGSRVGVTVPVSFDAAAASAR